MTPLAWSERWMLGIVAATCLLFASLTPPFQVPDEMAHYSRTWSLAHGRLWAQRRPGTVGDELPVNTARLFLRDVLHEKMETPTRYRVADVVRAATPPDDRGARVFVPYANVATYAPTLYLPQIVGLGAAELAGRSPLIGFYAARLVNAAAFLALLWAAVRLTPLGRPVLLAVAALPTATYQAASLSPDATIEGLSWLAIALSLRLGAPGARRAGGGLLVIAPLLGLAKGLYAPLLLAGARRGTVVRHLAASALAAAAFGAWTHVAGDQPTFPIASRVTGRMTSTAPPAAQLRVILAAPLWFARVLASSVVERSPVYLMQIVGRFGWNAFLLPLLAYPLALGMLAAGVVAGLGRPVARTERWWWAAIALGGALLVEVALYLTGSPLGADYVQGTQGRYFLPLLPLLGLALAPARGRSSAARWVLVAAALLNVTALVTVADAFWAHGFVNHRGLPPFSHDAAGIARALALPSPRW